MACGDFKKCVKYNDGCNDCSCSTNGQVACTQKGCMEYGDKECVECMDGYIVDDGECVEDTMMETTEESEDATNMASS